MTIFRETLEHEWVKYRKRISKLYFVYQYPWEHHNMSYKSCLVSQKFFHSNSQKRNRITDYFILLPM